MSASPRPTPPTPARWIWVPKTPEEKGASQVSPSEVGSQSEGLSEGLESVGP